MSSNSTQELQWLLTRKSSSFLVKQKGLGRVFSREPNNLANIHSYRHSGLVNDKSVGIKPSKSGKSIVVSTRNADAKPGQIASARKTQLVKRGGSRHKAGAVAKIVGKSGYRPDLLKDAVARASAISKTQQPSARKADRPRKVRGAAARKAVVA